MEEGQEQKLEVRSQKTEFHLSRLGRETLGRVVRDVWIRWAKEQFNPKPSWLLKWEDLSEADKEVDRRIGETVYGLAVDGAESFSVWLCRRSGDISYSGALLISAPTESAAREFFKQNDESREDPSEVLCIEGLCSIPVTRILYDDPMR